MRQFLIRLERLGGFKTINKLGKNLVMFQGKNTARRKKVIVGI